jgi:hypothetical protein
MSASILPESLIGVLFNKKPIIAFSNSKFHKVFYQRKKEPEYAELFDDIPFLGSPINPFSEVLDEALFNLQYAGALSRRNPELIVYSTTGSFSQIYNDLMKDVDPSVLDKINRLCDKILAELN